MDTHTHDDHHCPACAAQHNTSSLAYIHVPVPRLFHRKPSFRLTFLGIATLLFSIWYATESAMCANFCRPTSCDPSSGPCTWSLDDPTSFGTALPVKLDQWTTGGFGRAQFNEAYDVVDDWVADLQDAVTGRRITDVTMASLPTAEKRRQLRRRLRKKGLVGGKGPVGDAEERVKWDAWRRARREKERAKEAGEMGYM